jgi:hypothetical protein
MLLQLGVLNIQKILHQPKQKQDIIEGVTMPEEEKNLEEKVEDV